MSVDKLLNDLGQVLEEVKASAADKKGDEGQMVALYGMSLSVLSDWQYAKNKEWDRQASDLTSWGKQQRSSWTLCTSEVRGTQFVAEERLVSCTHISCMSIITVMKF